MEQPGRTYENRWSPLPRGTSSLFFPKNNKSVKIPISVQVSKSGYGKYPNLEVFGCFRVDYKSVTTFDKKLRNKEGPLMLVYFLDFNPYIGLNHIYGNMVLSVPNTPAVKTALLKLAEIVILGDVSTLEDYYTARTCAIVLSKVLRIEKKDTRGPSPPKKRKTSPPMKRKTSPPKKRKTSPLKKRKTSPPKKRKTSSHRLTSSLSSFRKITLK
jgi:hypothetical protein